MRTKEFTHMAEIVTHCVSEEYSENLKIRYTKKHIIDEKGRKYNRRAPWCGAMELISESISKIEDELER